MPIPSLHCFERLTPLAVALALAPGLGACTTVEVKIPTAKVNVPRQFHYRADFGGTTVAAVAAAPAPACAASAAAPVVAPQATGESLQRW